MKITLNHYDIETTWSSNQEDCEETIRAFINLLRVVGYHPNTIVEVLKDISDDLCKINK